MRPDTATSSEPSTIPASMRAWRLAARVLRLAEIQWRIILLRVKLSVVRFTFFIILSVLALFLALASLVCLFIAIFQGLALVLPTPLVWLIFGSILAIVAGTLIFFALRLLRAVNPDVETAP